MLTHDPLAGRHAICGTFDSIAAEIEELDRQAQPVLQQLQEQADRTQTQELYRQPLGGYLS